MARMMMEGLRVEIDDPAGYHLAAPDGILRGWFATPDQEIPEELVFQIGPITLAHTLISRTDVQTTMPDHLVMGFEIRYDLVSYLPYIANSRVTIQLTVAGYDPKKMRFQIEEGALAACLAAAGGV